VADEAIRLNVEFPGPARRLEVWNALGGEIRLAVETGSRLEVTLPGRGSLFVVAGGRTTDAAPAYPSAEAAYPFAAAVESGISASPGKDVKVQLKSPKAEPERVDLNLEWALTFEGPDAPPAAKLSSLVSWTGLAGGRFFSGTGIYRGSFEWTGALPGRCLLRFEQVREAAGVKLNGRSLDVIFNPPWAVEVGQSLRPGRNDLEIAVVNLPLNRFLGLPDEDLGSLRAKFGARFSAPEEKKVAGPAPSGLIGAVWLEVRAKRF
jgi:hypothetical protein